MEQPTLFDRVDKQASGREIALYALGDFQSRGKQLAGRELALDRLLGAFRRAELVFGSPALTDVAIAGVLRALGARVTSVPNFVAKHPYKVIVTDELAASSGEFFTAANKPSNGEGEV